MPDTANKGSAFKEAMGDAGIATIVALLVDALKPQVTAFFENWGKHSQTKFQENVINTTCARVEIAQDIKALRSKGKKLKLFLRKHREAKRAHRENHFVALIAKVPKQESNGRQDFIEWLDSLPPELFDQVLDIIDNDVVSQNFELFWLHVKPFIDYLARKIEALKAGAMQKIARVSTGAMQNITRASTGMNGSLRAIGDALEERHKRRQAAKVGAPNTENISTGGAQ